MRLQAGLLHGDGRPVSRADLVALIGPWATHPPAETAGESLDGLVALAYRGDRITPEDDYEVQPVAVGPYRLTWDGRLDNRDAIARRARLALSPQTASHTADAALVLAAYAAVGPAIVPELVGEFALALSDTGTHTLCLARSTCGTRPLYYARATGRGRAERGALVWATDLPHLVRVTGVDLAVNEAFVLGHLVFQPRGSDTPLAHVHAVPPNVALWFDATTGQLTRRTALWDPAQVRPLTLRSGHVDAEHDAEYEARCRELVYEAVRARLRAKHPVFAELSGGYDSSTVVLVADAIRRGWHQAPEGLRTVSCVYETSRTCDEQAFIRAVETMRGVRTDRITEQEQRITMGITEPDGTPPPFTGVPSVMHCFAGRYPAFAARMQAVGARVLLTGLGGDQLFWSQPDAAPVVADALWAGELRQAHQACRRWSRVTGVPYHRLLVGQALRHLLALRYPNRWPYLRPRPPVWLGPRYRARVRTLVRAVNGLTGWSTQRGGAGADVPPSQLARLFMVEMLFRMTSAGLFEEYPALYVSHPYTYRPLVEFCLSVPVTQHLRAGAGRSLMRRAFRDLLPERTATRVSKGELDETMLRAVSREWDPASDVGRWQVCERGFVEPEALRRTLSRMRLGLRSGRDQLQGGSLSGVFSLERWLRSLEQVHPAQGQTEPVHTEPVQTATQTVSSAQATAAWARGVVAYGARSAGER